MAPRLDDTTDVTLGGNPVGGSGSWDGVMHMSEELGMDAGLPMHDGIATIELPPGSAALVSFHFGGYK
jgi:hypothetical protein